MHGGQQTGYHRISGISSHLLRAIGSNIKVLIISMLPSTAIYNPPRLSYLKSLGESWKVCTPYRGDNEFSILTGGTFTFKIVSHQTVWKVSARVEKSVPHYRGDNGFSILGGGTFTFQTVSPDCLKSLDESWKVCTPLQGRQRIFNPHWGYFYF